MSKLDKEMQEHIAKQEELFERERLANAAYTAAYTATAYLIGKYIRSFDIDYVRADIDKFIKSYVENCHGVGDV